jgi:hypothetical protein
MGRSPRPVGPCGGSATRGTAGGWATPEPGRLQPPVRGEGTHADRRALGSGAERRAAAGQRRGEEALQRDDTAKGDDDAADTEADEPADLDQARANRADLRQLGASGRHPVTSDEDSHQRMLARDGARRAPKVGRSLRRWPAYDSTATPSSSVKSGSTTSWAGSPGRSQPRSDSVRRGSRPRRRGAGGRPARPGSRCAVAKAKGCARPDERRTQVICPSGRSA